MRLIRRCWMVLMLGAAVSTLRAQNVQVIFTFKDDVYGASPAGLVQGTNGQIYGNTVNGGTNGWGALYQLNKTGTVATFYSFKYSGDGGAPYGALTQGTNGAFYGTSSASGSNGYGTVFKITTNGVLTPFYSFSRFSGAKLTNQTGATPIGALTVGSNGNFYGTTAQGGSNGFGTVFQISHGGAFSNCYSFSNEIDGSYPAAALLLFTNGTLYGTALAGGSNGYGTVFELSAAGKVTPLYSFMGGTDGANPKAALINGNDGYMYGTCTNGGANGTGTIFRISPAGVVTPLYSFTAGTETPDGLVTYNNDGIEPERIILGSDNNFYGVTYWGGQNGAGAIFQFTRAGVLNPIYSFTSDLEQENTDGANPVALLQAANGQFYGAAFDGGTNGFGTLFEFGPPPQISTQPTNISTALHSNAVFSVTSTGALSFQWQFDQANIAGATTSSLSLVNLQMTNAGSYDVVLSNANGVATSTTALLSLTNVPVSFMTGNGALQYSGGEMTLNMTNLAGQGPVVVESSTNLKQWTPIYTNPAGYGTLQFTDGSAGGTVKFYRVAVP